MFVNLIPHPSCVDTNEAPDMVTTYSMSKIFLWDFELIFDIKNLMDCVRAKIFDSSLHYIRNPSKGKKYAIKQKEIKEQYFVIYILVIMIKKLYSFKGSIICF